MIRTALVDDEPLAREGLRLWLAREADIEIVGEAGDGEAALSLVARERPDLLFLDVQMPGLDGFETLARMAREHLPQVVFVTAHDRHAVRAFEAHALDYLLKPLDPERLAEALRRARGEQARGEGASAPAKTAAMLDAMHADPAGARFVVRDRGRFLLVDSAEVLWARSAGNYVELGTAHGAHLVRMPLAVVEARLGAQAFARIHRTTLVRRSLVREIAPTPHGDFRVTLEGGESLAMSRRYRGALLPARRAGR